MKNWEEYRHQIKFYKNGWVNNWFSNMIKTELEIDGEIYASVENYYQSQKMVREDDRLYIKSLSPQESKIKSRTKWNREDWSTYKLIAMRKALDIKFRLPEWKEKLLATGNDKIIEWNNWGDKFWGVLLFMII